MHPHARLIETFYAALARRDGAAMGSCYHPQVHFTDPVFDLRGPDATLMWRMLCSRSRDLRIDYGDVDVDDDGGRLHWEARYSFAGTGRTVHNQIDARFAFRDGLILRHEDRFDFWRWSRQALGPMGLLLGWSGLLQRRVQAQAAASLAQFAARSAKATAPMPGP